MFLKFLLLAFLVLDVRILGVALHLKFEFWMVLFLAFLFHDVRVMGVASPRSLGYRYLDEVGRYGLLTWR